jgi:hypothetical protein
VLTSVEVNEAFPVFLVAFSFSKLLGCFDSFATFTEVFAALAFIHGTALRRSRYSQRQQSFLFLVLVLRACRARRIGPFGKAQ